jgi:gentisate 1,2-dioxygenase
VEGRGKAKIADEVFEFEPRDTFVVPSWTPISLEAQDETVLFSFSDRPGQEAMGLWREQRG